MFKGKLFRRIVMSARKNSPEILLGVGITGVVSGTVMACCATRKVDKIIEEHKALVDDIHKAREDEEMSKEYSEKDAQKDLTITYAHTAWKFAKLYLPAVTVELVSICCLLKGHGILKKRNGALAAAYKAIDAQFKNYRSRVVDRFGKDVDFQLKNNITPVEVEETITDENGNTKTVKKLKNVVTDENLDMYSEYARFFDSSSPYWDKDPEMNLVFLKQMQSYWNDKLRIDGRVFLNDVYKSLGIPSTKAGQIVGWVYDPENPNIDNYIDFGIFDLYKPKARDFVNGYEAVILLDFNVDGNVWESM